MRSHPCLKEQGEPRPNKDAAAPGQATSFIRVNGRKSQLGGIGDQSRRKDPEKSPEKVSIENYHQLVTSSGLWCGIEKGSRLKP